MTVTTESDNVWTKIENVRTKLIVYGHYVHTLVNPYFKLCIHCCNTQYLKYNGAFMYRHMQLIWSLEAILWCQVQCHVYFCNWWSIEICRDRSQTPSLPLGHALLCIHYNNLGTSNVCMHCNNIDNLLPHVCYDIASTGRSFFIHEIRKPRGTWSLTSPYTCHRSQESSMQLIRFPLALDTCIRYSIFIDFQVIAKVPLRS